jgi:hypothetical protein
MQCLEVSTASTGVHQVQRETADQTLGLPHGKLGVTVWKFQGNRAEISALPRGNFVVTPAFKIARFTTKTLVSNDLSQSLVIKLTKTCEFFLLDDQN